MELKLTGVDSLMRKLNYLGGNVTAAIDKGLGTGANKIKADAKRFCPYDTGRLKGGISSERIAPMEWAVGTNVLYAPCVEFGTGRKGSPKVYHTFRESWSYKDEKGQWHTSHGQPPRPFLYPAMLYNKDYVFKACRLALAKAVREAMNNG